MKYSFVNLIFGYSLKLATEICYSFENTLVIFQILAAIIKGSTNELHCSLFLEKQSIELIKNRLNLSKPFRICISIDTDGYLNFKG